MFRATLTRELSPFLKGSSKGIYYDLCVAPLFGGDLKSPPEK